MIFLFKHKWNRRIVRVVSFYFLLSTLLLCIALIPETEFTTGIGIMLYLSYIILTCIALIIILVNVLRYSKDIQEHTMTLILLILNCPISMLYLYFIND
ncbi:hypothetical protein [Maribacter ulvicola]|uniref:hypothetical protein n=1 Tax=Maribacter ulvicola TaxID=228959 RepID=UPI00117E63F0|nr:hypothetical protein [Maribacter ulvicola]